MSVEYQRLKKCFDQLKGLLQERTEGAFVEPEMALVLGSGLGNYTERIHILARVKYSELEGFPVSTVPGHMGCFVYGRIENVPIICMQGRVHYYEGYSMKDVVMPIRLMGMLGAKTLFLTNAAGGIQIGMNPGDLMLITGQIASFVPSPLIGENVGELGARFPDMSEIYDRKWIFKAKTCATKLGIDLREGTYMQLSGPQYETPQEVAMCRRMGADAVGMSTACEAVAANHMGLEVIGISVISNMACGITSEPLSNEEVQKRADEAAPKFEALVTELIKQKNEM